MEEVVIGLDDFVKALDATTLNLTQRRKLIAKGLRKAGEFVAEEQRRRAPDDPATAGSRIASNIGVSVTDQSATSGEARAGMKKWGFVARFLEHGTSDITARPWMGPAFDDTQEEAVEIFGGVVGDGIEDAYRAGS